jgi:hypothetical protein
MVMALVNAACASPAKAKGGSSAHLSATRASVKDQLRAMDKIWALDAERQPGTLAATAVATVQAVEINVL